LQHIVDTEGERTLKKAAVTKTFSHCPTETLHKWEKNGDLNN